MKEKIYVKTKHDGLWEDNPHLAFAIYIIVYIIALAISIFVYAWFLSFLPIFVYSWFLSFFVILFIFSMIFLGYMVIKVNQSKNMSKSTAFIEKDGKLFVIQLMYQKHNNNKSQTFIHVADPVIQAATLKHNIDVAINVQEAEREVRNRRKNIESFKIGLNSVLEYLEKKPEAYHVIPNYKRTFLDNILIYNLENAGLATIIMPDANYNFLILNNPKLLKENTKNFTISFYNEKNELCNAVFTNCYGDIINVIKKMSRK